MVSFTQQKIEYRSSLIQNCSYTHCNIQFTERQNCSPKIFSFHQTGSLGQLSESMDSNKASHLFLSLVYCIPDQLIIGVLFFTAYRRNLLKLSPYSGTTS